MSIRSYKARRLSIFLVERRVSGLAILVVLVSALLFGLVGFAVHAFWVLALVVLALALGFLFALAIKGVSETND